MISLPTRESTPRGTVLHSNILDRASAPPTWTRLTGKAERNSESAALRLPLSVTVVIPHGSASFGSSDVGILRGNYRPFAIPLHEHLHHHAVARLPWGAIRVFVSPHSPSDVSNKEATHWTRLSRHRFRANEVRLLLGVIAYNLDNLLRRLVLPPAIQSWSLTSLQQRLFKTGGRLIRHARYFTLQLAENYLTRPLFQQIVARIEQLAGAFDLIERTGHAGRETRSGSIPAGVSLRWGGHRWRAAEHAGPAGQQESGEGPPVIYSVPAERQLGERATRLAM